MNRTTSQLRSYAGRSALLVVGSTIAIACFALTIRAGLGLGPLFVVQQGLARTMGMSIGHAVTVSGVAFVVIAAALRSPLGPGTLVLPFLGGWTLDALLPFVPGIHGMLLRIGVVLVATLFMGLGGTLIIRASVGVAAYDAVMLGLGVLTGRPLAPIRLAMECTMLVVGWLLGGDVGVGTVLTGVIIGPAIQFWLGLLSLPVHNAHEVRARLGVRVKGANDSRGLSVT